jgi:CubicO group peptidase (beta-lactamase class C family)
VGISAAVSIDGQVVWAGAAGFAEIGETPRSLDTSTAFRIGATTQSATQNPMLASLIDHAPRHLDGIAEFYEVKHGLARQRRTAGQIQTLPDGERLATSSDLARLCGSAPLNATARYEYGGVSSGAMTWLVCYPESRLGVAININSRLDNFSDLTDLEPPISRLYSGLAQDGNLRTAAASPAGR